MPKGLISREVALGQHRDPEQPQNALPSFCEF